MLSFRHSRRGGNKILYTILLESIHNTYVMFKCYPHQKRMAPQQISEFTLEQFLDVITGGV